MNDPNFVEILYLLFVVVPLASLNIYWQARKNRIEGNDHHKE